VRCGSNICYGPNSIVCKKKQSYYSLTFTVEFPHDDDLVHFAHCYPFTWTDQQSHIHAMIKVSGSPRAGQDLHDFLQASSRCNTCEPLHNSSHTFFTEPDRTVAFCDLTINSKPCHWNLAPPCSYAVTSSRSAHRLVSSCNTLCWPTAWRETQSTCSPSLQQPTGASRSASVREWCFQVRSPAGMWQTSQCERSAGIKAVNSRCKHVPA